LPVVLIISAIVIELAIAGVIVAAFLSNTVFSSRLSSEALAAARAGAQDAIVKIMRYKNCNATSCGGAVPYTLSLDGERVTAYVEITDNLDNTLTVKSTGTALVSKKKIQAIIGIDPNSGKINVLSFQEIPL
jgi:membrane protein YqaA with SNARE-associated domain